MEQQISREEKLPREKSKSDLIVPPVLPPSRNRNRLSQRQVRARAPDLGREESAQYDLPLDPGVSVDLPALSHSRLHAYQPRHEGVFGGLGGGRAAGGTVKR